MTFHLSSQGHLQGPRQPASRPGDIFCPVGLLCDASSRLAVTTFLCKSPLGTHGIHYPCWLASFLGQRLHLVFHAL